MQPIQLRMRATSTALGPIAAALFAIFSLCGAVSAAPRAPAFAAESQTPSSPALGENELRQMLLGKTFYLRGGYLDDTLNFNQRGLLEGHSPQGSYTLNLIQVEKVRLGKRRLQIEGIRYGLHFFGALASEEASTAFDRVRITPPKKTVRIAIGRERVVKPKKHPQHGKQAAPANAAQPAAAQPAEDYGTTTSPAQAARMLRAALDRVFAPRLDAQMIAAMPAFWRLYYQAAAAKTDTRSTLAGVLRQNQVDRRARLLASFEPDSNQYAQNAGVAGMALYHAVIEPDGKPGEIAVGRPIGFGLDENAVAAIARARFQPAIKSGHPVPVLVDLIVEFRIYSKRTAALTTAAPAAQPPAPDLPGPYSVKR